MFLDLSMIAYVPFNDSYALIFEIHLYQIGLNEAINICYLLFILERDNYKSRLIKFSVYSHLLGCSIGSYC